MTYVILWAMGMLTTTEFAEKVDLTRPRIIQLLKTGEIEGEKKGRDWWIDEKFVQVVLDRPERRGRTPKKKAARLGRTNGRAAK